MTLTATLPRSFPATAGQEVDLYPVSSELTVAQAAALLRASEKHVNNLLNAGRIASRLENGKHLVQRDSLLEFAQWSERGHAWLDERVRENQEMGFYDE